MFYCTPHPTNLFTSVVIKEIIFVPASHVQNDWEESAEHLPMLQFAEHSVTNSVEESLFLSLKEQVGPT